MSDSQSIYERLAAPFDLADHSKVSKGSGSQTYAPWTAYVQRLNAELGKDWSFRVVREGFTETECWVLGEITATIDGVTVTRQQYGCEPIMKGSQPAADLLKTAASDAIKKAASLLGPGLYLSIKEEREAVEAELRAAVAAELQRQADERAERNKPKTDPTPRSNGSAAPARPVAASTQAASGAASSTSSTTAMPAPSEPTAIKRQPETVLQRWERLVAEATRLKLPTLGTIKAIDPTACGEMQMKRHADRLEVRLIEVKQGAA